MDAIILAGGIGKRLRPITDYIPKPLIPINNVPIIEWQIRYLKGFNIKNIVICAGFKAKQIENHLKTKNNLGTSISFSIENTQLGTGGAIKKAKKYIKDSFIVINGDTISNLDINKLKEKKNSIAAIELRTKFGVLDIKNHKVSRFLEKKELSNFWMNAGIYYLDKTIMKDLPVRGDIEKTTFPDYAKKGKLNTVKFTNVKWYSIDSFKDIEECSKEIDRIF
ncbi:MAG: NTP transferase domain-containing protein [Nitrosopumilaceae archaeon]|nr:nucleotidyltransferase family protein [Nitrosopumilaceae archaeon]NIU01572.1 nucleotidyltransferase family protein [Nitrosopumilaceae archaeon]NIU88553.1 NTP transferase domain-containing protein [Nitrosopumilaceae archaeon]NIV66258.1 NTP transferase domain-containing protein [Nitrosopumilaceae archaeon]NIX62174.1 NTP transferase domain-containing protein [Nitrosopumilaceae archaeon]